MSRYIKSTWKVTYDPAGTPLVLLDHDDWTLDELAIPWRQEIDHHPLIGAAWGAFHPRGNVNREVQVSRVASYSDDASLREAILAMDASLAARAGEHKPLRIAVLGGDTYGATKAVILSHTPRLMPEGRRVAHYWTLVVGAIGLGAFSSGFSTGFGF